MSENHLAPPRPDYAVNSDHIVPISPARPPFGHYHSSSSLPITPREDSHTAPPPPPPPPFTTAGTRLRPCLTLGPRLFLTTLSPALIPLVLTIAHLIANRASTSDMADSLRANMLSACAGLAKGAASLQMLPRYLAMQTNEEAIRATQATIRAMGAVLMDVVTIIEKVVMFMVETYRSLLMCTIELAVRGTLELLIGAVREITSAITTSLNAIRTNIQNDISSANRFIQDAVSRINTATRLIGVNLSIPEFTVPSLAALQDVKVSNNLENSLLQLNSTIPSLAELRDKLEELIQKPFALLKTEINATRLELAAGFNSSILPTPPLSALSAQNAAAMQSELCGNLDTSLVDETAQALRKLSNASIGLMVLLLFLVWAALAIWEWRRWKVMKDTVETIEYEWQRDPAARDPWRVVAIVEHPMVEKYGSPVLRRLTRTERARINFRWYMSYLGHPTCLALLFIALLGLLSLQFQLLALNAIKSHIRANANATVAASTNSLAAKLNDMAANSSRRYAQDFNSAVASYQAKIDQELFGNWVNTTGVALNNTLVSFYDDVEAVVMKAFGGTVLYSPMNTFIYCILGGKIDSLSAALTWLRDHAHITLPTFPDTVLLLSPSAMSEIAGPISAAAVGSSSGSEDEGLVGDLIRHFQKAIEYERNFYAILLGVWAVFALAGLVVVIWNSGGSERYHSWRGGPAAAGAAAHGPETSRVWPWGKAGEINGDGYEEKQLRGSPSPNPNTPPIYGQNRYRRSGSFFDHEMTDDDGALRPAAERKSSLGLGSIGSLFAPAERFLNFGRAKTPLSASSRPMSVAGDRQEGRLVEKGATSEAYNKTTTTQRQGVVGSDEDLPTPPPLWVNRFYGEGDRESRSIFPTRGQKHGQAVASSRAFPTRPESSLHPDAEPEEEESLDYRYDNPTPYTSTSSRAVSVSEYDHSRYPSYYHPAQPGSGHLDGSAGSLPPVPPVPAAHAKSASSTYPRPMSRASTMSEGEPVQIVTRKTVPAPVATRMPLRYGSSYSPAPTELADPFANGGSHREAERAGMVEEMEDPYADRWAAKRFTHTWRGERI